ncbi:E3 ubiquitin-protein ligase RFWD3-like [Macrosteles quadrilineatus]|uniref:E3 ubiquitin-protein ligase RFWD3-like n=1 Tax=Macrosteles quadrilineatus TaxID=74068 RepID=UPI0023E2F1CE|nr:E3 ubiquitin-protein ligase RFWD3-like [Macrosteles quadrilineatus]XP_054276161.1 E3 ubiquitin-protein ligase RFWD3-like [Macrosteles quadrilineatus]
MEDDTSEDLSNDSEYTGSFLTDTDAEEELLTWDSEDSRPPGPSPDIHLDIPFIDLVTNQPVRRRRRGLTLSISTSSSQELFEDEVSSHSESPVSSSSASFVSSTRSTEEYFSEPSDWSDEMALSAPGSPAPLAPPVSPTPAPAPAPVPVIEIPSSPEARLPVSAGPPVEIIVTKPVEQAQLDSSVLSEGEDGSLCTICMCPLTNSGTHRVVCLRCGHIFGQACVERWIKVGCNNGARRCPTCNKKAALKDIRVLYLPKVVPLDTIERDRILQEKEELAAQKKMLEADFTRTVLQHKLVVESYEEKISNLKKQLQEGRPNEDVLAPLSQAAGLAVVTTVTISSDGGCRVMAFNPIRQDLVVSQPSGNTLFAGFGVRVLNSVDWQPSRFVLLHSKAVRDIQFHPDDRDMMLSVSLDQNAKLFDLGTNTTVHTFKVGGPLWSCCWDASHPHLLLLGTQTGKVVQYDRRMTDTLVNQWEINNNKTPVVALASTPCRDRTPFPQGGFLSCRLNAVYSYTLQGTDYNCSELGVEGPFMSMRYDGAKQMMITTSRASSRYAYNRVSLSLLDKDANKQVCAALIHSFNCGSSSRNMSRSTLLPHVDDSLMVAHNESARLLDMWSSKRGDHLHSLPIREPIIDLTPVDLGNNKPPLLAALSEKKLTLYKINR